MLRIFATIMIASLLFLTLWSCDDDSPTGPDLSEAPDAPSLENVQMDFSIFEDADSYGFKKNHEEFNENFIERFSAIKKTADFTVYEQAAFYAYFAESWFQAMKAFPLAFFQEQMWGEPEVDGDTWIWEWRFAYEGESLTIRVTAETVNNERHWELRYTLEGTDDDVENELFISSRIRLDGTGGKWQMYDLFDEGSKPVFVVEYELDGDLTTTVDMHFDEQDEGRFLYQSDGTNSSLKMWDIISDGISTIEWNNDTGTGSFQSPGYRDGQKVCWDENYQDTEC